MHDSGGLSLGKSGEGREGRAWLLAGLLLLAAPFLFNFLFGRTFAPMQAFYATNSPYIDDASFPLPQNHFWVDTTNFYLPRIASFARGDFPISFSSGGGTPVFADTISGYFSPYVALVFGLFPFGLGSAELFWLLQFVVYYLGTFLWLRKIGLGAPAAFAGAITQVFCTSVFPGSYLSFQTLGALSFLPWVLWASEARPGKVWLSGLFLSLSFLSGNIQTAVYPLLALAAWFGPQRRFRELGWIVVLGFLGSAPLWTTGIEYHVLLNISTLEERRSQIPDGILGRLKALLALPALLIPELYGSSKHLDFLKVFSTSATYFIGSVGLVGPLLAVGLWRRADLRDPRRQFALLLVAGSVLLMLSPLLSFFYYRIICLVCFGLSVLLALSIDRLHREGGGGRIVAVFLWLAALLAVGALAAAWLKASFHAELSALFARKLSGGNYAWLDGLIQSRIDRWFGSYLVSMHFLALPLILVAAAAAVKYRRVSLLVALVAADVVLLWGEQVTFDHKGELRHGAYARLDGELRESSFYPLSRYLLAECGRGPYTFHFAINEYQAVPSATYYGSTYIDRLPIPMRACDETKKLMAFDEEKLRLSAINAIVTYPGWRVAAPGFVESERSESYVVWKRPSPYPALGATDSSGAVFSAKRVEFDGWGFDIVFTVDRPVAAWYLSLPFHRDWRFFVDGERAPAGRNKFNLPEFGQPLAAGEHRVRAKFVPLAFLYGFLGCLVAIILALWKPISIPASTWRTGRGPTKFGL